MISRIFAKKNATATTETVTTEASMPSAPLVVHKMENGLVNDSPVEYTLYHVWNGTVLQLRLNAGAGHTAVTAYPAPYEPAAMPMQNEGDLWVTDLTGFKEGDKVQVHFVVVNGEHQADNSNAPHHFELLADSDPIVGEDTTTEHTEDTTTTPSFQHEMPNGMIKGNRVNYSIDHTFDGSKLSIVVSAGPGHQSITAYPTPHEPAAVEMRNEDDKWIAELDGFKEGDELEIHFVIGNNGEQADNSSARHRITVPAAAASA